MSDITTTQVRSAHDLAGLARLKGKAAAGEGAGEVAQQFEALFIKMALKTARDAMGEDPIFGGNGMRMYQDMFDTEVATEIAGSLGLANLIEAQIKIRDGKT